MAAAEAKLAQEAGEDGELDFDEFMMVGHGCLGRAGGRKGHCERNGGAQFGIAWQ